MRGRDLLILKAELGIESNNELRRRLGIRGNHTLYDYLLWDELPLTLALAAAALSAGLEPYAPDNQVTLEMQLKMEAGSASTLRWMELKQRSRPKQCLTECEDGGAA